ncbi:murein L,D-transpeptidase family protein [Sediminibacterium sp. C3]|uniref:L,D-transpeptidase family protein n=1 Tax=Sediminibacterium sp. C3 TaxID=1267211 RepID=UPI0003FCE378|nr:L,D-transpeptidase family protein [Sediminibacterium sp. C3]
MKYCVVLLLLSLHFTGNELFAQDFKALTKKEQIVFNRRENALKQQFQEANLSWPAKQLYIRSFKQDGVLELWVKNSLTEPFVLFKTYNICALSGKLGPKRREGDKQVPEGIYYINEFNPNSDYHFSLGLNYPNQSDLVFADRNAPGGEIYIHGQCATVGCIPILNSPIEELYVLASIVKKQGQDYIPVHIYPIRFNNHQSAKAIQMLVGANPEYHRFTSQLKDIYDYFEQYKQLPIIGITQEGSYKILVR